MTDTTDSNSAADSDPNSDTDTDSDSDSNPDSADAELPDPLRENLYVVVEELVERDGLFVALDFDVEALEKFKWS